MDFVFNAAKGRGVEWYYRVENNDPASCAFVVMVLAATGLESDAVLIDKDSFTDILSGTTNEVTNTNYARKVLTDSDLAAFPSPDDANDRYDIDVPDILYSPGPAAGDAWAKLITGFDYDTGAGTDAAIIPMTAQDLSITPDGNVVNIVINTAGILRAQAPA